MLDTRPAPPPPRPPRSRVPPSSAEDGFVIMVAVAMLAIALAIGAAALGETLASRNHADRDARVKRALQAADAGIGAILYQQNELPLKSLEWNGGPVGLGTLTACEVPQIDASLKITGLLPVAADAITGVCPDSSSPPSPTGSTSFPVGAHAWYQARFIPGARANGNNISLNPKIVSLGYDVGSDPSNTAGYTVRRIEAILAPVDPFRAIEASGNLTITGPTVYTLGLPVISASTLNGNARANGNVTLPSTLFTNANLNGSLFGVAGSPLGTITYGPRPATLTGSLVGLTNPAVRETSSFTRSPVSISPSKTSCPSSDPTCSTLGAAYNSATDSISQTSGSGTISFAPGDYVFCNFNVTSGAVAANSTASAPVRIFIDSSKSARCSGNGLGSAQGNFTASRGLGNLIANTTGVTGASGLQIYVVGDQAAAPNTYDNATTVTIGATPLLLGSGVVQNYVVYAPTSKVNVNNCTSVTTSVTLLGITTTTGGDVCAAIQGAIIGDDVTVKTSAFTQDLDLTSYPLYAGLGAFHVAQYLECEPAGSPPVPYPMPTPDPTAGC